MTNTCRKPCEEKKDCNGTKLACDTSTGFCVNGEIYFEYNMVQGFMFYLKECNTKTDCRKSETCDTLTNTCKKTCEEKKDCNGTKQTCDTSTGFCEQGKCLFSITPTRGSYFAFKNAIQILTAEMVRYVTK